MTGRDEPRPRPLNRPGADVQRRRREMALTAIWLRELRGLTGSAADLTGSARFTRPR
jgi:hypothetical protein